MLMLSCSRLSICLTTTSSLIQLLPSTYCWPWPFYLSPPISFLLTLPPSLSSINDVVWFWDSSHSTFKNLNNRFIYIQHYSSTQVSCWMLLGKHTHTHWCHCTFMFPNLNRAFQIVHKSLCFFLFHSAIAISDCVHSPYSSNSAISPVLSQEVHSLPCLQGKLKC